MTDLLSHKLNGYNLKSEIQILKQLINILIGAAGIGAFPAEAAPAAPSAKTATGNRPNQNWWGPS